MPRISSLLRSLVIYVGGFFVDFDDFSNILLVNCGLYPFRNGIFFSKFSSFSNFEFWFSIFHE